MVEVKNTQKRTRPIYPAILTKHAWSIKDLLQDQNENFFLAGPTVGKMGPSLTFHLKGGMSPVL